MIFKREIFVKQYSSSNFKIKLFDVGKKCLILVGYTSEMLSSPILRPTFIIYHVNKQGWY